MGNVWARVTNVAAHFPHDTNVLIAVEKRVLVIFAGAGAGVGSLVGLERGIGEDDDEALSIFVASRDWRGLLGNEAREVGRRQRLGS